MSKGRVEKYHIGLLGGLVSGMTIFAYQYLLSKGWKLYLVLLMTIAVFIISHLMALRSINQE